MATLDRIEKIKRRSMRKDDSASILTSRTTGEKVLFGIIFVIFSIYTLIMMYPLAFLFLKSLQQLLDFSSKNLWDFSRGLDFANYWEAITTLSVLKNSTASYAYLPELFLNSIVYCFVRILLQLAGTCCTAYVLSKYKFPGRNFIYGIAITTMVIPVVGSQGSAYKLFSDLRLLDTPWFLLVSSIGSFGFNFLVLYGFFSNISWSYAEAVFIDGGGHFTVFLKIMLPQASVALITLAILAFISTWNDYMTILMYMPSYPTLASGLYNIGQSTEGQADRPKYYAALVISTVPVIVVFASFSDIIMKNFSVGGLKG
jgi:ABC-type glycerol-3-phosphate transport system permease component